MRRARSGPGLSGEATAELMATGGKIAAHKARSAQLRHQMRREFDPGYIYVVQFSTGIVKPGKAVDPEARLGHHARLAEFHGAPVVRSWVSEYHLGISKTERRLLRFCEATGKQLSGEYFTSLLFDAARECGQRLVYAALLRTHLDWMVEAVGGDLSRSVGDAWAAAEAEATTESALA
jgi:hypothetical protein